MQHQPVGSTGSFLDSLGVNTHLASTSSAYNDTGKVIELLDYLGIDHVRDGIQATTRLEILASHGTSLDILTSGSEGANLEWQIAAIERIEKNYGAVDFVEGPNETDIWPVLHKGMTGFAATRAFQADLYGAVHGSDALNGGGPATPVIQTSLGNGESYKVLGNLSGSADYANIHSYYFGYSYTRSVADQVAGRIAESQVVSPGRATIATEGGWSTATQDPAGYGVSESVQAILTLNMVLDQYKAGVSHTYIYQLFDEGQFSAANLNSGFGLFRADGSAKPAATAIHNLNAILGDQASNDGSGTLSYTLQGMPGTGKEMLLRENAGIYDLVLWNEPVIWDAATDRHIGIAGQTVTVEFGEAQSGKVYDPLNRTNPISTFSDKSSIEISLSDRPMIVEISRSETTTFAVAPASLNTPQDEITLRVSQDAYQGDAQFIVWVDDKVVGGLQTISASHHDGQTQDITLKGDFEPGSHKVTVAFENDLSDGAAGDRNMYLHGITVNGTYHAEASADLLWSHAVSFDLTFG